VNEVHNRRETAVSENDDELVGLYEVAELANVSRTVVANWRVRDQHFPAPVADLRSGPVFRASQIRRYVKRRRTHMAHVIATINLKGGVGKTTVTAAVAEILAGEFGKNVLVIDLDPQTNLTTMMIGDERWGELNARGHTLAALFQDALRPEGEERQFDLDATLQRGVSPVRDVETLDLLPSSLDLIDVQDRLGTMSPGKYFSNNPTDLLRRATQKLIDDYHYVLVDCPPNLGIVTLNGLRIADGYMIPTIPDVLSTYGIPQIRSRVRGYADNLGITIAELGIVISKYRAASTVHNTTIGHLEDNEDLRVFNTWIPEANKIAEAAEYAPLGTVRQRWGYAGQFEAFLDLTKEIMASAEEIA
jgi:chromosome partitioning protein